MALHILKHGRDASIWTAASGHGTEAPAADHHYNWGLLVPLALSGLFWLGVAYLVARTVLTQ